MIEASFVGLSFMVTRRNMHSNYRKMRVLETQARTHRKIKSSLHVLIGGLSIGVKASNLVASNSLHSTDIIYTCLHVTL